MHKTRYCVLSVLPLSHRTTWAGARVLAEIAQRHSAAPAQIALAWLLARSPIMLAIPGTSSVEHLEENIAAMALQLTDTEVAELEHAA